MQKIKPHIPSPGCWTPPPLSLKVWCPQQQQCRCEYYKLDTHSLDPCLGGGVLSSRLWSTSQQGLNPFATVLFSVCSAVTVECCVLYPCCMGVFGMFAVMWGRRLFSSVFVITERRDIDLYGVPFLCCFFV